MWPAGKRATFATSDHPTEDSECYVTAYRTGPSCPKHVVVLGPAEWPRSHMTLIGHISQSRLNVGLRRRESRLPDYVHDTAGLYNTSYPRPLPKTARPPQAPVPAAFAPTASRPSLACSKYVIALVPASVIAVIGLADRDDERVVNDGCNRGALGIAAGVVAGLGGGEVSRAGSEGGDEGAKRSDGGGGDIMICGQSRKE